MNAKRGRCWLCGNCGRIYRQKTEAEVCCKCPDCGGMSGMQGGQYTCKPCNRKQDVERAEHHVLESVKALRRALEAR
jgi:hypothetical protein